MHNVEKWLNILENSCGVQTARFLKYDCPFLDIIHERKAKLSFLQHFLFSIVIKVSITTKHGTITLPIFVNVKILTCESFVDENITSEEVFVMFIKLTWNYNRNIRTLSRICDGGFLQKQFRCSRLEVSVEKMFLEISRNSQGNTCTRVSFLIKLQAWGLMPATLLKKRLWHRCFPVNFTQFLRTLFLQNTSGDCF